MKLSLQLIYLCNRRLSSPLLGLYLYGNITGMSIVNITLKVYQKQINKLQQCNLYNFNYVSVLVLNNFRFIGTSCKIYNKVGGSKTFLFYPNTVTNGILWSIRNGNKESVLQE